MVDSILPRWRTMPASCSSRSTSRSPKSATASTSKPAKAARKFSRLRRMVSHDSPDWKPSRQIFSNSRVSSRTGRPHSVSWYARYSVGAAAPEAAQQTVVAAVEQVAVDEGLGHRA